mmetsp:Transcript_2481/g.3315  ORF Transcript_2481/g.3315 Transcript_2481/m.3315 type:complete len:343 (-) Transcript_2481:53-1081(-)
MVDQKQTMSIVLIDAESDALTISWHKMEDAIRYSLQYRRVSGDGEFETLSDKLIGTQARKKNLTDESEEGFIFRVGGIFRDGEPVENWVSHEEPFKLFSKEEESSRMETPNVALEGISHAALVSWKAPSSSTDKGYEIQMRESSGGSEWRTIAPSFSALEVRKKNLTCNEGYQFRVRLAGSNIPFSPASDTIVTLGLSDGMKRLFGSLDDGNLVKGSQTVSLEDALGGKEFVLLYASASWCGPCRQFTPQLVQWYRSLSANSTAEVIFLSADHDESGFKQYYSHMPWLAIDFDDDTREQLMGHIKVTGIPRLAVLDGRTGRIIEDNGVGKPLDINRWRSLVR